MNNLIKKIVNSTWSLMIIPALIMVGTWVNAGIGMILFIVTLLMWGYAKQNRLFKEDSPS
jgi:hypothetical protein